MLLKKGKQSSFARIQRLYESSRNWAANLKKMGKRGSSCLRISGSLLKILLVSLISLVLLHSLLNSDSFQEQLLAYTVHGDLNERFIASKGLQLELARQEIKSRVPGASYPDNKALYLIASALKLGVVLASKDEPLTIIERSRMGQVTNTALLATIKELKEENEKWQKKK